MMSSLGCLPKHHSGDRGIEAFIGWLVEETTLEVMRGRNRLPHLSRYLGRFPHAWTMIEFSPGSGKLGIPRWMPSRRDSPSLPKSKCHFLLQGLGLWPTRMRIEGLKVSPPSFSPPVPTLHLNSLSPCSREHHQSSPWCESTE